MAKERDSDSNFVTLSERYRDQLEEANERLRKVESRLKELAQEKEQLELDALQLRTQVDLLSRVCNDLEKDEDQQWTDLAGSGGIQECCYRVLVEEGVPLNAINIRHQLGLRGIDLDKKYSNALAVIHTSLKRIPDRVRSFKQTVDLGSSVNSMRFYEAIKPAESKDSTARTK